MRVAFAPLTALVTVAALAIVPACGFPTLSYEDDGGPSSGGIPDGTSHADGSGGDTGSDGSSSPDGEPGGDASSDVASDTAQGVGDGSMDSASHDSSMPPLDSGDPCDRDGDGYKAMGGTCGGTDCCDTDFTAHPNQTAFPPTADFCGSFDYNCDGMLEGEYPVNLTCTGTGLTGCHPMTPGFTSDPGCGGMALLSLCQGSGALSCAPVGQNQEVQGCH